MCYNRLMDYYWQHPDWPEFHFESAALEEVLLCFARHSGRVSGLLEGLPAGLESETVVDLMISEALTSSAIEGEVLDPEEVRSSIRNELGLNVPSEQVRDLRAAGIGELMVAVRSTFADPLGEEMLFAWHRMLMKGERRLEVGTWRTDSIQVVSGRLDRPTVHFEGPPAARVPEEMARFCQWFNATFAREDSPSLHPPVRAGIAHLYFETIHPFEDGNGRIGRAIAEKALAQGLGAPVLLSLSQAIETHRDDYYDSLKRAQRGGEITAWLQWFCEMVVVAQQDAEERIAFVLKKSRFLARVRPLLSERQGKVIMRMLEAGPEEFEGGMNARKYVALTKVSKATATRDLQELARLAVLKPVGAGRSTRYELQWMGTQ